MSMSVSYVYGYGFNCNDINEKKFIEFLSNLKHKPALLEIYDGKEILEFVETYKDIDFIEQFQKKFEGRSPIENCGIDSAMSIIADIMVKETDIHFGFQKDMETDDEFIMFCECMPYLLNDTERNITESDLHNICVKYMAELGLPTEEKYEGQLIGMQKVEYFG